MTKFNEVIISSPEYLSKLKLGGAKYWLYKIWVKIDLFVPVYVNNSNYLNLSLLSLS